MVNCQYINKIILYYQDGGCEVINDSYKINQISGLLSLASIEDQEEIKQILNEEEENGTI